MRSRNKRLSMLVLALVIATVGGAFTMASAACGTFTVTAAPNPQRPDLGVTLNVSNFHDQFFNCIEGQQLDVFIQKPGDGGFPGTPNGQTTATDASGNATFNFTATNLYDTYVAEVRWPVNPSVKATSSFTIAPGLAAGTFVISPTALQPGDATAGNGTTLGATQIVDDQGKPVHNGTDVDWTLSAGSAGPACYLARPTRTYGADTTGVADSDDVAGATVSVPGTDLQVAGKYNLDAAADNATRSEADAFVVYPANVDTLTATAPATARPGTAHSLGVQNARDQFGNPVGLLKTSTASFTFTLDPPVGANVVYPGVSSTSCGSATVLHQFGTVPSDDPAYGVHTWTAQADDAGAESHTVNLDVQPGRAFSIASASASGTIVAGHAGSVIVNGITDDLGFAAKTGTPVELKITGPSSVQTTIGTVNVAGVDSGNDTAAVSFTIPGSAVTQAGDYTGVVTSEDATKSFVFSVIPDVAVVDMVISAPNVVAGDAAGNTVTVSSIPAVADSVELRVTRPDGTTFTLTNTPPTAGGSFGGQTTFDLTDDQLDQVGLWGANALASDNGTPVGVASGTFTVAMRVLGVTLNTAPNPMSPGTADRIVTVSNLPDLAATARLVVTKPDGTTITLNAAEPSDFPPPGGWQNDSTTFTIPKTSILKAGTWSLVASALSTGGNVFGTGTSSFQVKLPVSAASKNLGDAGSVLVTNVPIKSASTVVEITVTKPDTTTLTLTQTPSPANNGFASFALAAATLDTVGTYNVVARVKDGAVTLVTGAASFKVSLAPDALAASMSPEHVGSLGGRTVLTATATKAGVPVAGRTLQVFLTHALTGRGMGNWTAQTNGLGQITITMIGQSQTGLPGQYVVTVRDAVNTSLSTTTTFDVQITGLGI